MEQDDPLLAGRIPEQDRHVRLLLDSGLIEECETAFDDAVASAPNTVDSSWSRPIVLVHRAMLAWRLGRISLALELAADAWAELDAERGVDTATAHAISMLGYLLESHSAPALELLSRGVTIARQVGDTETLAHCLIREATALVSRALTRSNNSESNLTNALERYDEAATLVTSGALWRRAMASSARALVGLEKIELAEERAQEALSDSNQAHDVFSGCIAEWTLGEIHRRQNDFERARTYAARALDGAERIKENMLISRFATDLSSICGELGDHVGEATALRRAVTAGNDTVLALREGLGQALEQRRIAVQAQQKANAAEAAALRDPLTGLTNRLGLQRYGPTLLQRTAARGRIPWFLLIDVDWFKGVNDRAGHAMGDTALREVANLLQYECREEDVICRWAGDEFVVLLLDSAEDAHSAGPLVAERVRDAVDRYDWERVLGRLEQPPTVSIGAAAGPARLDDLFTAADDALYRAKHSGRNRVEINGGPLASPEPASAD